jgi:hypothetical protein
LLRVNAFPRLGELLGSTEDAARVRVSRALNKLELLLKWRGITTTSGALGALLGISAIQAAPAGLSTTTASTAALAKTAAAGIAVKSVAVTAMQKSLVAGRTATVLKSVGITFMERVCILGISH